MVPRRYRDKSGGTSTLWGGLAAAGHAVGGPPPPLPPLPCPAPYPAALYGGGDMAEYDGPLAAARGGSQCLCGTGVECTISPAGPTAITLQPAGSVGHAGS